MAPRYKFAIGKAKELLAAVQVEEPPVPIERLARQAGATVRYEPFEGDLSGMVHRRPDGGGIIGVNSLHNKKRQRFTIAHEIGHFLLHRQEQLHVDERFPFALRDGISSLAVDDKEIEANQFAAELLMPEKMLVADLREMDIDVEDDAAVQELADRYDVSLQAMAIRLSKFSSLSAR